MRFPDDGGADEVVAAIGEQILGPTDVSLSNWTVRPSSGCSVVLATHTAGVSVDGYTLTLTRTLNIVRTYNLTPGQELLFACRYRLGTASNFVVYMSKGNFSERSRGPGLAPRPKPRSRPRSKTEAAEPALCGISTGLRRRYVNMFEGPVTGNIPDPLYGSFVGDQGAWSTAKMYFTVPPNGVAKLHFGAHWPAQPDGRNGGRVRPPDPDATLETENTEEEDTAATALLLKHEFLDGGPT